MARAERLQAAAAAASIAMPELDAEVAFEVGLLLHQYDLLERRIADASVAALLDGETARRLQMIPGVCPAITVTLLAEIGDINRFGDFDQLLALQASTRSNAARAVLAGTECANWPTSLTY